MNEPLHTFHASPDMPRSGTLTRHYWSKVRVAIDWSPFLDRLGTTIAESDWVTPAGGTVVLDNGSHEGALAAIDVSGGNYGDTVVASNRVRFGDSAAEAFCVVIVCARVVGPPATREPNRVS